MSFWQGTSTRGSTSTPSIGVIPENVLLGRHAEQGRISAQHPGLRLRRPKSPKPVVYARVWIKEARDLVASDISVLTGVMASDPLVSVRLAPGGRPQKTGNYIACLEADWNTFLNVRSQELHWNDSVDDVVLELTVMDLDLLTGDDPLGVIRIPVMNAYKEKQIALQDARESALLEVRVNGGVASEEDSDRDENLVSEYGDEHEGKTRRRSGSASSDQASKSRKQFGDKRPNTVLSVNSSVSTAHGASRPSTSASSASVGSSAGAKFMSVGDGSEEYLLVRVIRASNLPATDFQEDEVTGEITRSSDPYVKLTCSGETWGTAVVPETVDPDFVAAGEEPFWFPIYSAEDMDMRFEMEWQLILPKLPVKVIGYTTDFKALEGVLDDGGGSERIETSKVTGSSSYGSTSGDGSAKTKDGIEVITTLADERAMEERKLARERGQRKIARNIQSIKSVMHKFYAPLCDAFEFYSTWDSKCEEWKQADAERAVRRKQRAIERAERKKKEAQERDARKQARLKRQADVNRARNWMNKTMMEEQRKIQRRIAEKFERQIEEEGQTIRDIFIAFDEDGGGTIDHEELRDGFDALGVELNDLEFERMLLVWDEDESGEIDFDEFAEMFEKTLMILEEDRREKEKAAAEEWMKTQMGAQKQEQKIQKRIAEKFRVQIKQKGQTIRDIFIAFDEDGGGTIDHEELRDGFSALGVRLNDREFNMMLKIWDKDNEGEIEFDEFADMFEKTLLVLEVDDTKREEILAEEDAKEEAREAAKHERRRKKKEAKKAKLDKWGKKRKNANDSSSESSSDSDSSDSDDSDGGIEDAAEEWADRRTSTPTWADDNSETISPREFVLFCRHTGILDGKMVKIRTIQEVFRLVNTEQVENSGTSGKSRREGKKGSPGGGKQANGGKGGGFGRFRARGDAEFERSEFLASMVHLAIKRHPRPPTPPPTPPSSSSESRSSSSSEDDDLEMAMLMQSQIVAGLSQSRPKTPPPHWLPGDSLRKLMLENVRPSMETSFEVDDEVNRTRASREYLDPKEAEKRRIAKEAKSFAGQTRAAKEARAAQQIGSKLSEGRSVSSGSDSDNEEDPMARQRRLEDERYPRKHADKRSCLRLSVWDHDVVGDDDFLGECYINICDIEDGRLDYANSEAGEMEAQNFLERIQKGRCYKLKPRPGVRADNVMVQGELWVSCVRIRGCDAREWDQGRERVEVGGNWKLEFHPEMAEEDHDPAEMHGELSFKAMIEIPRSLIRRRHAQPERERLKQKERKKFLSLNVHACDAWCTKTFQVQLPNIKRQGTGKQSASTTKDDEFTFRWLSLVAARRYNNAFKPHGRVRARESGRGGTEGALTPQGVYVQMPEGFDRLDEAKNLVMTVDGDTPLRKVVRSGDDVWVFFQNRKPNRVIIAGGPEPESRGHLTEVSDDDAGAGKQNGNISEEHSTKEKLKALHKSLGELQREQWKINEARSWLKRTCRDEQEKIQLRIAQKFRMLQRERGQSIEDIFIAFDEDGGGTIDHEELRDGFDALGVELNDAQFKRMLSVWDESGDGEIDFEEFVEMFAKTQLMLDVDARRKLITFDAIGGIAEGSREGLGPIGISEAVRLRNERRAAEREERRLARLRKEAEERAKRLGGSFDPNMFKRSTPLKRLPFTLKESVWAPRQRETDSGDWYDTDELFKKACIADMRHAHRLNRLIKTGPDYLAIQEYLCTQYRRLLSTFRKWAASDAQFGPFQMTWGAFTEFATSSTE